MLRATEINYRRIAGKREELKLRQEDLARMIGVSPDTIAAIESGCDMKAKNLIKICRALQLEWHEVLPVLKQYQPKPK